MIKYLAPFPAVAAVGSWEYVKDEVVIVLAITELAFTLPDPLISKMVEPSILKVRTLELPFAPTPRVEMLIPIP